MFDGELSMFYSRARKSLSVQKQKYIRYILDISNPVHVYVPRAYILKESLCWQQ